MVGQRMMKKLQCRMGNRFSRTLSGRSRRNDVGNLLAWLTDLDQ